jgi:hypothetical protein
MYLLVVQFKCVSDSVDGTEDLPKTQDDQRDPVNLN